MVLIINLFSLPAMIALYESHAYLQKYLTQGYGNTYIINGGASVPDIERILKGQSIKYKIKKHI
jgi:hypothetical protein